MNFKKLLRVINACLYVSAWSLFFLNPLRAGFSVTAQVEGDRVVSGKINETNLIRITMTITGDDAGLYNSGQIKLFMHSTEFDGSPDVQSSGVFFQGKATGIANGTAEITVSATELQDEIVRIEAGSAQNDKFALRVKYLKSNGLGAGYEPSGGGITDWGAAGTHPSLSFNNEDPKLATNTGSFFENNYFNSPINITIAPSKTLFPVIPATDYKSYIKLRGVSGADSGNDHYYFLSGTELSTGSVSVTDLSFTTSNGSTPFALVDGSGYDVTVYLYDEHGNLGRKFSDNTETITNQTFDTSLPTVSRITTTEGTDPITKKVGDKVYFRIIFSEPVKADQAVTVTFETHA